jgi:membrane-associated protease RseP (regulator of RpoE activity)
MFSSSTYKSKAHWAMVAAAAMLMLPAAFAVPGTNSSDSGAYLGVVVGDLNQAQAANLKMHDTNGVMVQSLDHDGPACRAGIQPNDVIVSVNGMPVSSSEQMVQIMHGLAAGSMANIGIIRDGKSQQIKVALSSRKSWLTPKSAPMPNNYDAKSLTTPMPPVAYPSDMDVPLVTPASARRGIVVEALTAQLADYFGVPGGQGVLVRNVQKGSLGATAGLKAGDVIFRIDGQPVRDLADWRRSMNISGGKTSFSIIREKREQTVDMVLPGPASEMRLGEEWDYFGRDMDALNQQLERLGPEIQKQTEQAMMFRSDDLDKMQREIEKSVRKGVQKELKHESKEIRKSMKQLEPQIRQQTEEIQKQMEQMRPEIDKQVAAAQEQMKQLGPEFQKQMEEMRKAMALKHEDIAKMQAEIAASMKVITPQIQEQLKQIGPQIQEQMKVITPQLQQQMRELQKEMQQHQKEMQDMMKSWPNSTDRPNEM